ncbi:nucleoside recognition domain-containing protein [Murimonas intestini]|uniref:Spore maturation protein A n=1 Tax=Murimonas intestini TaxID=1337051 RepID=A0AB73T0W2_9FIRM|nr:nucleoside recognition domain-containing protein [Murimonas intestini]MCR1840110.1 nucleoside recognition protein [Murimonas intestini]MCR1867562.1 nucleoside recognition protein [Murimonas intestini]MCR1885023.1 nucleoside recognition protein [Murimonas intestini]
MNYLWGSMILIGIIYGAITGNMQAVTDAALSSSKEAVTLCITMVGVMSLWVGIMEIARDAGLIQSMSKKIRPFIRFMFPDVPDGHPAQEHITTNIIANFLGLGWAATPAGLEAMEALEELNVEECRKLGNTKKRAPDIASRSMCTFLILNISSLQLIPVNIIAYRSQYGSANPTSIVGPSIVATLVSTVVGIIFCKVMERRRRE